MTRTLDVDPDIARAQTPPGWLYTDPDVFAAIRERVFVPSWQLAGDRARARVPGATDPFVLHEGLLDEPLLFSRDREDRLHCLSNVCTHRGNLVCEGPGVETGLRCRYHGRRFGLDGRFHAMGEFEGVADFPSAADDLAAVPFGEWGPFRFVSLAPAHPLAELVAGVEARCGFLPLEQAVLDPARSRDYLVRANWALYVENFLEGFHVPFVHGGLAREIDYGAYRTECFARSVLQLGISPGGETFAPPAGHPDQGAAVAAYWFWLFPNTMLNVYPWGISVNIVRPLAIDRARVSYLAYVWDPARLDRGASADLDRVEREDEAVVETVQRGLRSRLYRRGRYSPAREQGVHCFHRLLSAALGEVR